jgi:hypothetical protein
VLFGGSDQLVLFSNQLRDGERDEHPLAAALVRDHSADRGEPPDFRLPEGARPLDFVFEDTLHLVGVVMPESVERGEKLEATLYFKVLKPVGRNWKVFVHIDSGASRIIGDHDPIGGTCGTSFFRKGDIVVDRFSVKAGGMVEGTPRTSFQVFAGFFTGSSPNFTNMKVSRGKADENNRVNLGTLRVE